MRERQIGEAVINHAQGDMSLDPSMSHDRKPELKAASPKSRAPSTSSVLWAAWRQGLKDLQTAVLGGLGGTHEELGTIANPVQQEVYQDRHNQNQQHEINNYDQAIEMVASRQTPDTDRTRTR